MKQEWKMERMDPKPKFHMHRSLCSAPRMPSLAKVLGWTRVGRSFHPWPWERMGLMSKGGQELSIREASPSRRTVMLVHPLPAAKRDAVLPWPGWAPFFWSPPYTCPRVGGKRRLKCKWRSNPNKKTYHLSGWEDATLGYGRSSQINFYMYWLLLIISDEVTG